MKIGGLDLKGMKQEYGRLVLIKLTEGLEGMEDVKHEARENR